MVDIIDVCVGATCTGVGRTISIPLDNACPASIDVGPVTRNGLSSRIEPSTGSFIPIGTDDFDWRLDIETVAGSWCRAATIPSSDMSKRIYVAHPQVPPLSPIDVAPPSAIVAARHQLPATVSMSRRQSKSVSYTHLTLPRRG